MREIIAGVTRKGIKLNPDIIGKTADEARAVPFETRTSLRRDIESGRSRNEAELFGTTI